MGIQTNGRIRHMLYFPKELFELQVNFAYKMAEVYGFSFEESLFKFTTIYPRLIGFSDTIPQSMENKVWRELIEALPADRKKQANFIYNEYVKYEDKKNKSKPVDNGQIKFGCFSYFYKEKKNIFALHFINADPKGNLSSNRISERKKELMALVQSMKGENKKGARVYITSWLFSIDAMTRLFPPEFVESAKPRNKGLSQDNGSWGQFVDRNGNFKQDMADKLMRATEEKKELVDEYFPLRMMRAETKQDVFFDYYLNNN